MRSAEQLRCICGKYKTKLREQEKQIVSLEQQNDALQKLLYEQRLLAFKSLCELHAKQSEVV